MYAISTATGLLQWSFNAGAKIDQTSPLLSFDGSSVYFGTSEGKGVFYSVDAETGHQQWNLSTGSPIYSSPALSCDGKAVFFGSSNNLLYAVHTASGKPMWTFVTGNHVDASPTVSADGAHVFVGSGDGNVYAVDAANGRCVAV